MSINNCFIVHTKRATQVPSLGIAWLSALSLCKSNLFQGIMQEKLYHNYKFKYKILLYNKLNVCKYVVKHVFGVGFWSKFAEKIKTKCSISFS